MFFFFLRDAAAVEHSSDLSKRFRGLFLRHQTDLGSPPNRLRSARQIPAFLFVVARHVADDVMEQPADEASETT